MHSPISATGFTADPKLPHICRYGNVANDSAVTVDVGCDTFLSSRITYRHTALSSPKTDYLQGLILIKNVSNGAEVDREWFSIRVTIEEGLDNRPPTFR